MDGYVMDLELADAADLGRHFKLILLWKICQTS